MTNESECTVKSCRRNAFKASLCSAHYQRKQKYGNVREDIPVRDVVRVKGSGCTVEGCDRPRAKGRSLCHAHRERMRHVGDVQADVPVVRQPRKIEGDLCGVEGCLRPRQQQAKGRGRWCSGHRSRLNKTGRLDEHIPLRWVHSGDVTEWCSYPSAHWRVGAQRGKASDQKCITCGDQAIDWAYRGNAKHEFQGQVNGRNGVRRWSGDPADYDPMCRACHVNSDRTLEARDRRAQDLAEGGEMIDKDFRIAELEAEVKRLKAVLNQLRPVGS